MKKTSNVKTLVKKRSAIESGAKFSHSHSLVSGSRCVVAYIKVNIDIRASVQAACCDVNASSSTVVFPLLLLFPASESYSVTFMAITLCIPFKRNEMCVLSLYSVHNGNLPFEQTRLNLNLNTTLDPSRNPNQIDRNKISSLYIHVHETR